MHNAQRLIELEEEYGGHTANYMRSHSDFYAALKDVRKQFKYMGDTGTYLLVLRSWGGSTGLLRVLQPGKVIRRLSKCDSILLPILNVSSPAICLRPRRD